MSNLGNFTSLPSAEVVEVGSDREVCEDAKSFSILNPQSNISLSSIVYNMERSLMSSRNTSQLSLEVAKMFLMLVKKTKIPKGVKDESVVSHLKAKLFSKCDSYNELIL